MGSLIQLILGMQTLWFLLALGGHVLAYKKFLPAGDVRKAKLALRFAIIGELMLCVISGASIVLGGVSLIAIVMLALFGYYAFRDISVLADIS